MSSVSRRIDGKWRARYRNGTGKEFSKHFDRKADGQRWIDEVTAAIVTGTYVDPRAGKVTVKEFSEQWEAVQVGAVNTLALIDNALRLHILPTIGSMALASVRRGDIQALVKTWSLESAPGSVRNYFDVLARMFSAAVEDKHLLTSPCKRISLPPMNAKEVIPPTVEEVARITEAMPARYRAATVVLAGSGLRIGELLGLRVSDIHVPFQTVRVERQRLQSGLIGPPKAGKSRNVPVGEVVLEAVTAHLGAYPSDEWLFCTQSGEPITYQQWQKVWRTARKKAELPNQVTHDLRHFFASALISNGASVKQVQMCLGHSSPMITLRVYSHLWPGDDDRTRAIMDSTLEVLRTVRGPEASTTDGVPAQTG
jgi:integrase